MATYKILFLGDIVGKPGREAVAKGLPKLVNDHRPEFVLVNGENSAAGLGITPAIADELFGLGIDGITLGNHAFNKKEIYSYLDTGKKIIRPGNLPSTGVPGSGTMVIEKHGVRLLVVNLCGRVYMEAYDDPFAAINQILDGADTTHVFLDFHAEATSEKIAMGYHCEGRVTAVVGTHTHVTTADERVLPGGTATITDVGMTGPANSVLGMRKDIILGRFRTQMPARFEVADESGVISGVVINVETSTGRAVGIERVQWGE